MTQERDPKTDPMRGDVLRKSPAIVIVRSVTRSDVFCTLLKATGDIDGWSRLEFWRQWAADATVIHKGEKL